MSQLALLADQHNHHPDKVLVTYGAVEVWLTTHEDGNVISDKDRELSRAIDKLVIIPTDAAQPGRDTDNAQLHTAKLYTDGGSRGNPGPSALGYALLDMEDNVVEKDGFYLGLTTNNQAEYQGLKYGLEQAKKLGVQELTVYMDSLLVVNQMKGIYKVKNRDLWPIHEAAKDLASQFKSISFVHVPRELNSIADGLVNDCLDANT